MWLVNNRSNKLCLLGLFLCSSVHGELLTDRAFNFGKIAVTSNSSVSSVQMSRSGQASATNFIHIIELGTPGVYSLTDMPAYTVVNLTANVPAYSSSTIPGTQQFILRSVDMPSSVNTGQAGIAQFTIGGVLETSGLGGTYIGPASYNIDLAIDISF